MLAGIVASSVLNAIGRLSSGQYRSKSGSVSPSLTRETPGTVGANVFERLLDA